MMLNDAENDDGEDDDGQPAGDDKCLVKILGELCTRRQNGRVGRSEISSLSLFSFEFTLHVWNYDLQARQLTGDTK